MNYIAALVLISALLAAPASSAQTVEGSAAAAGPKPPAWDTIAIHPVASEGGENDENLPDGMRLRDATLQGLLGEAYRFGLGPFRDDEISGLPDWARTQRFEIVAHVSQEDIAAFDKAFHTPVPQMIQDFSAHRPTGHMLMLQSLLVERFHLRVHYQDAERTVYAVVVDSGGPKLKAAKDDRGSLMMGEGFLSGKGSPATFIANLLGLSVGREVLDRTGLKGNYDFELKFTPDALANNPEHTEPDIFTAIREQLGLRLESTRAPVQTLVVDHIEQPTPN